MLAPPRHRSGLDEGGLSADPRGRRSRHRRRHGGGLRGEPGGQFVGPSRTHQVRPLSRAAGPPGVHPKSGWLAKDARHSNLRGQGGATRCDDDAGGSLRTGLLTLLVWLPPGPLGSPGAPHFAERTLGQATLLGDRHRHTQVFRFDSALSPPNVPRPTSHGRRHPTDDRQMAEGGGRRRRSCAARPRVPRKGA